MSELLESRFEVVRVLGEGSIGRVLLARDRTDGREVALKALSDTFALSREARLALRGEYLALERLRHPRIVAALEYAEPPGQPPFYTMEYVPGPDLSALQPLEGGQARDLLAQALEGLAFLHSALTMHNDIRPENLRLGADGSLRLLGFGLSGPTGARADMARRNALYVSPEALAGGRLDPRSDLFSLGAVFYHLLTGRPPFDHDRSANVSQALLAVPPMTVADLRPDVPSDVADLVMRLLAGSPHGRPASGVAARGMVGLAPQAGERMRGLLLNPPLVGRQAQVDALREATSSTAPFFHVSGTRGAGRTHLLEAFAARALADGHLVVRVDAREGVRFPYNTLAAIHRRLPLAPGTRPDERTQEALAGELGALEPRAAQLRAQCAWAETFRAAAGDHRLILAIDNADEADEASLTLLKTLARRGMAPIAVVAATGGAVPENERGLALDPLSGEDTAAVAAGLLGLPAVPAEVGDALHARCGGNPGTLRVVLETAVRDGLIPLDRQGLPDLAGLDLSAVPDTAADLGRKRLATLPYPAWQMSEALAVSGGPQRFARLGHWLGLGDNAIAKAADALLGQGLLAIGPGGGRLTDPDAQAALLADLPGERRSELHARIASGIEQQGAGDETTTALAEHLAGAGDPARAATVAVRSAHFRLQRFCLAEADRMLALAEKGARPGTAEQSAILVLRADQARYTGRFERAFAAYERALPERSKMANRPDLWGGKTGPGSARILLAMAACRQVASRNQDALKLAVRAAQDAAAHLEKDAGNLGATLDFARAKALTARLRWLTGDGESAPEDAAEALEAARRAGDPLALADALAISGELGLGAPERDAAIVAEAVERLEEARALREELGDWVGLADCQVLLGKGYLLAGQYAKAIASVERGLARRRELGIQRDDENLALLWVAESAFETGALGPALALTLEVETPAQKAGDKHLFGRARALHARICSDLGRLAEALACAEDALDAAKEIGDAALDLAVRTVAIPVWVALGDCNRVYDMAKAALLLAEKHGNPDIRVALMLAAAEAALVEGDSYRATERLTEAQKMAGSVASRGLTARLLVTAARQTLSRGNDEIAQNALAEAQNAATGCGMAAMLAQVTRVRADILAHKDSHADAARTYAQAHAAALDLGLPFLVAATARGLADADAAPPAVRKYLDALEALREAGAELPDEPRDRFTELYIPKPEDLPQAKVDSPPTRMDRVLADFGRTVAGALCGTVDLPGAGGGAHRVLEWLLEQIVAITGSERGIIEVRAAAAAAPSNGGAGSTSPDAPRIAWPHDAAGDADLAAFSAPHTQKAAATRQALCVADAPTGAAPAGSRKLLSLDLHGVICVPLLEAGHVVGVLYLDRRAIRGRYTDADLQLAVQLAVYAALAIAFGRLKAAQASAGSLAATQASEESLAAPLAPEGSLEARVPAATSLPASPG